MAGRRSKLRVSVSRVSSRISLTPLSYHDSLTKIARTKGVADDDHSASGRHYGFAESGSL